MSVDERLSDPFTAWPPADELEKLGSEADLVLLPDVIDSGKDGDFAGFRDEAQALRVEARAEGLTVLMYHPEGTGLAVYREHAADWVLPVVLAVASVPLSVISGLIVNRIQRAIDRGQVEPATKLIYREAVVIDGNAHLRQIEGTPEDVARFLRERAQLEPPPDQSQ